MVLSKDELVLLAHNYDMIQLFIEEYGINPKVLAIMAIINNAGYPKLGNF